MNVAVAVSQDARGPVLEANARDHEPLDVAAALGEALLTLDDPSQAAVWIDDPTPDLDAAMEHHRLNPQRDLYIMEISLPLSREVGSGPGSTIATRPFVPGRDEASWVHVNNRAFAWHREQSGWTMDDVRQRMEESWFDPNGFLIHEVDGKILGFCWTKIHTDLDPPAGEIYVIAVDPDGQGRGLGRSLTVAGLMSIHARGLSRGFLYVDADNTKAVSLYLALGFTTKTVRRLYTYT